MVPAFVPVLRHALSLEELLTEGTAIFALVLAIIDLPIGTVEAVIIPEYRQSIVAIGSTGALDACKIDRIILIP